MRTRTRCGNAQLPEPRAVCVVCTSTLQRTHTARPETSDELQLMSRQRIIFAAIFLICAGMMATAFFMQHVMGLEPCPLCMFQRVFVIAVGVVALVAALHDPRGIGRRIYAGLLAIGAMLGAGVATRHVYLQHLPPDQVPACGPGMEYMFSAFPFMEALEMVLGGSGECAEVSWMFLGLSIPGWTLIVFSIFAATGIWMAVRPPTATAT